MTTSVQPTVPLHRRTGIRWSIASIAGLMSLVAGIDKANIAILAKPLISTHLVTAPLLGLASAVFLVFFAISNVVAGVMIDRFGVKRLLAVAASSWGVITALTAVFWAGFALVPIRGLLGLGEGFQGPSGGKWVKEWFPTRERSISTTIQNAGLWVGGIVTGPLVTWLYLSTHSVSTPWIVMGAGTLVLVVPAILIVGADRPEVHSWANQEETTHIRDGQGIERVGELSAGNTFSNYRYWIAMGSWCGMATVWYGLTFWFPLYMENVRHLTIARAGVWYALPYVLMALFAVGSSLISDKVVRRAPFFAAGTLLAGVFLFIGTRMSSVTLALLIMSLGLAFNGFVIPNVIAFIQQLVRARNLATVYGVCIALEVAVSAIGTYIIGLSFASGFIYMEAFSILGGLAAFILVAQGV